MPEYHYEFEVFLGGYGPNQKEAWETAVESFVQHPGEGIVINRELADDLAYPDEPEDNTPIEANKLREFVEIIARMKTQSEADQSGDYYQDDDSIEALDELIVSARQLTGIKPEKEQP